MGYFHVRHDPGEAVPYFEKYLKLRPQDPRGKLALGTALFRAKDYDAAVPRLEESSQDTRNRDDGHYYLGALRCKNDGLMSSQRTGTCIEKSKPDYTDSLAGMGQYY